MTEVREKKDFFISYTGRDEKWATWIAWTLEDNGYTTYLQAWDFKPSENFVRNMDKGLIDYERFIAVLSDEYLESVYCQSEWTAAFTKDPNSERALFIPVRVEDCKPKGLLAPIIYIDLYGVEKEEEAIKKLIEGVSTKDRPRNKPVFQPVFPGTKKPRFPGQLPFNNLPYVKNIHFTGRKEILDKMENLLKPGQNSSFMMALCGMGGVGKTQVALEYAINKGYLYDTIWWVNAENSSTLLKSFTDLLSQKGIIKNEVYKREDILSSVWRWMGENCNWLFVYDDAENAENIYDYLPRNNTGHILITSRSQNWLDVNEKVGLDVFKSDEAVLLLKNYTKIDDADNALNLAKELGYLPLALDQAAAYILENKISYDEYTRLFRKYRLEIFAGVGYESITHKDTVAITWNVSLGKIDNESAKQLVNLCAFLAPDHISKQMFIHNHELLPKPLADDVTDELKFNKAIADLARYSLIQFEKDQISIHCLLQEVILESLKSEEERWFDYCAKILNRLFIYDHYDMEIWVNCADLMPHVQSVLSRNKSLYTNSVDVANLYSEGALWLVHTALYDDAIEWYGKALAIREKVLGTNHPDTATTYNNIAAVYDKQGEYGKALEWYGKALGIYEKVLGTNHPETATTYNNIAVVHYNQGEYGKALEWYGKALAIREKVLGTNHPATASTYNNIALVYYKQGEYGKAQEWLKKANR